MFDPDATPETWPTIGFTRHAGIDELELAEDGTVHAHLSVEDHHLNTGGVVHGGVLATILDVVLGSAVVRTLEEGQWCATQALNTEFLRPATGDVRAIGRVDQRGRTAAYCSGEVLDGDMKVVARATGVWAIRAG